MDLVIHVSDEFANDPDFPKYAQGMQGMVDRMGISAHIYGPMGNNYPDSAHAIDSARQRSWMYDGVGEPVPNKKGNTGNTENCLDSANFYLIEYACPSHPKAKFKSQEHKDSPGIVMTEGDEKFNYVPPTVGSD